MIFKILKLLAFSFAISRPSLSNSVSFPIVEITQTSVIESKFRKISDSIDNMMLVIRIVILILSLIFGVRYMIFFPLYSLVTTLFVLNQQEVYPLLSPKIYAIILSLIFFLQDLTFFLFLMYFLSDRFYIKNPAKSTGILIFFSLIINIARFLSPSDYVGYTSIINISTLLLQTYAIYRFCLYLINHKNVFGYFFLGIYGINFSFFISRNIATLAGITISATLGFSVEFINNLLDFIIFIVIVLDYIQFSNKSKLLNNNAEYFIHALKSEYRQNEIIKQAMNSICLTAGYDKAYLAWYSRDFLTTISDSHMVSQKEDKRISIELEKLLSSPNHFSTAQFNVIDTKELSNLIKSDVLLPIFNGRTFLGYILFVSTNPKMQSKVEIGYLYDFATNLGILNTYFVNTKILAQKEKEKEVYENIGIYYRNNIHEIKIPLISLENSINYIKDKCSKDKQMKNDLVSYFESIDEGLSDLKERIKESLSIVGDEEEQEFSIDDIKDSLGNIRKLCFYYNIELTEEYLVSPLYKLSGPKIAVINVIQMLLKNSIEAIEQVDIENKKIDIVLYEKDNLLYIKIIDNGKGMSKQEIDNAFGLYTEGKMAYSGQGLMLCKSIINRLNGDINIESSPYLYTKIEFYIDIMVDYI